MKISIAGSTSRNGMKTVDEFLKFSQDCGRICYSEKNFEELLEEPINEKLIGKMKKSGHHSVFGHIDLVLYLDGLPKIFAMVLNNEKLYNTSEKSARYTVMKELNPLQKEKYDKWSEIFVPIIGAEFPKLADEKKIDIAVKKLCQENARYMTSVFTPTKMAHKVDLRQLNFLRYEFEKIINEKSQDGTPFEKKLIPHLQSFLDQTSQFKMPGLENQTSRRLSLFDYGTFKEQFGTVYSRNNKLSFAGLAQAHRHRTIDYRITQPIEEDADKKDFFVPAFIRGKKDLEQEWKKDLRKIGKDDYPQAQLLYINERSTKENFRSKQILRLCGHAQYEIMESTKETSEIYGKHDSDIAKWSKPKCAQGMGCADICAWGKKGIERII